MQEPTPGEITSYSKIQSVSYFPEAISVTWWCSLHFILVPPDEQTTNRAFGIISYSASVPRLQWIQSNENIHVCNVGTIWKELLSLLRFSARYFQTLYRCNTRSGECSWGLNDRLVRERAIQPTPGDVTISSLRQVNTVPAPVGRRISTSGSAGLTAFRRDVEVVSGFGNWTRSPTTCSW